MSRLRFALVSSCVLAAGLAAASAEPSISLHMNTGLWETTSKVTMGGMNTASMGMSDAQLAQMPPAARAQVQAMMAKMNGVHVSVAKNCVTQKELDHPFKPNLDQPDETCKTSVITATPVDEKIGIACTGVREMHGTFHFSMTSMTTMAGHMSVVSTDTRGHSFTFTNDMTGRWLGGDCGSVKPSED